MAEDTPQTPTHDQPEDPAPEASTENPADATTEPTAESINITFTNSNGSDVTFKLKRSTKLGKAMNAYSARSQKDIHTLRFLFDGERITADDTADTLSIEDQDRIEVHMEQIGGADNVAESAAKVSPSAEATKNRSDALTIRFYDDASIVRFKVRRTTKLGKAMDAFSALQQQDGAELRFVFRGQQVKANDTAETLSIFDGDTIDVYNQSTDPCPPMTTQDIIVTSAAAGISSGYVMLHFCDDESRRTFKIKPTCKMGKVMVLYTSLLRNYQTVHGFYFKGKQLKAEDTVEKAREFLCILDGDVVEVHTTVGGDAHPTNAEGDENWLLVNHDDDDLCEDSEDDMPAKMAALALRNTPAPDDELTSAGPTIPKPASDRMVFAIQHCTGAHAVRWYKSSVNSRLTKALRRHAEAIGIPIEELDLSLDGVYIDHNTVASTFATREHRPVFVTSHRPR